MKSNETINRFNSLNKYFHPFNLVRSLTFTDEPKLFHYSCLDGNIEGSAGCDLNENIAKIKAMGEFYERFCLDNPYQKYNFNPKNKLDIEYFVNFRDEDLDYQKKSYIEKIKSFNFAYITGLDMNNGYEIDIPAQLVYVNPNFKKPIIKPRISTGAALHSDLEIAIKNGIMENIERDSYMISYLSKRQLPRVILKDELKEIEKYFGRYNLELIILDSSTNLEIPSFICLNIDKTGIGPAVSVGLNADLDPKKGIYGAIMESQQVRQWIRYKYLLDNRPNIDSSSKIKEVHHRGYYWYPKSSIDKLDFWLSDNNLTISQGDIPKKIETSNKLVSNLLKNGIHSYMIDIGHEQIKDTGFDVVKILQPELHPLFLDQSIPCLTSNRLKLYMKDSNKLNKIPHPFM